MKLCVILATSALLSIAQVGLAEEKPAPLFTALSSTTVRGYVYASDHWQRHVCRPVAPVRVRRAVYSSPGGGSRVAGRSVRCRHGVVFVPNSAHASVFPAPNRSSRLAAKRPARPFADHQAVLIEANRMTWTPGFIGVLPPLPPTPLNPTNEPPFPPIVVIPRGDATFNP